MRSARARPLKPGVTTRCNDSGEDVRTWGGWFIVLGPERVAWWDCACTVQSYWREVDNCGKSIVLGELSWGCMLVLFIVLKGIWELRKVYRPGWIIMGLYACIVYCTEGDLRTAESLLFCAFHDRVVCLYCSVVLKGIFKTAESWSFWVLRDWPVCLFDTLYWSGFEDCGRFIVLCVAWWGRMLVLHTRVQKGLLEIRCPGYTPAAAKAVRMIRTSAEMLLDPSLDETLVDEGVPQPLPAKDARKSLGKNSFQVEIADTSTHSSHGPKCK